MVAVVPERIRDRGKASVKQLYQIYYVNCLEIGHELFSEMGWEVLEYAAWNVLSRFFMCLIYQISSQVALLAS